MRSRVALVSLVGMVAVPIALLAMTHTSMPSDMEIPASGPSIGARVSQAPTQPEATDRTVTWVPPQHDRRVEHQASPDARLGAGEADAEGGEEETGDARLSGGLGEPAPGVGDPLKATILVAGDIASCAWTSDSATARLVDSLPGVVMTAGDNAYQYGTYREFRDCYGPTWGRFRERTRPTPGNHEWYTPGAEGYFRYFGALAGPAKRGYYAFDAGAWRVYALTSDCSSVGGCRNGTPQNTWLRKDLADHPRQCVLAVWHRPRFSSGTHGSSPRGNALLKVIYRAGGDVVVNGHDHIYERFAPARPDGSPDQDFGIRQFIVGTGGAPLYAIERPYAPNSRVRDATSHGVLRLTLEADRYAWEFLPVPGDTLRDQGSGTCHGAPPQ